MTDPESQSMTDALRSDHHAIAGWLADARALNHTEEGAALREQVVMNLVRHFVAEEQYFYPAVRDSLERGDQTMRERSRGSGGGGEAQTARRP